MTFRAALAAAAAEKYVSLAVNVGASMVLARLLRPEEIGIFSIAATLVGFAAIFRDFGANQYVVQSRELSAELLGTVWSVQMAIGVLLCFISLALAIPIGIFYREDQLTNIVGLLAVTFLLTPLGAVSQAWLTRSMKFGTLAVVRLAGNFSAALISCVLAYWHMGALGLAIGSVCSALATAAASYLLRPKELSIRANLTHWRTVCSFGSRMTLISALNSTFSAAPELFIGRTIGMGATGIFSRATGLLSMFNRLVIDAVYSVSFAWFSREARAEKPLDSAFVKGTGYLMALGWSFFATCYFLADPIVFFLYGANWLESVSLVKALAIGAAILVCPALCSSVLIAMGKVSHVATATALATVTLVVTLLLYPTVNVLNFAQSVSVAWALCTPIWLTITWRTIRYSIKALMKEALLGAIVALFTGFAPFLMEAEYLSGSLQRSTMLFGGVLGAAVGFVISIFVFRHGLADEVRRTLPWLIRSGRK